MIDRTHTNIRCHTMHLIHAVQGDLPRDSHGTVVYEMDNLGRHLIFVRWDNGIVIPMFPSEVEFESDQAVPAH